MVMMIIIMLMMALRTMRTKKTMTMRTMTARLNYSKAYLPINMLIPSKEDPIHAVLAFPS